MNRILFFLVVGAGLAAGESTCLVPKNPPKDWKPYDSAIDEAFRDTSGDRITDLVNLEQSYLCMVNYIIMQQPVPQQKELFRQSFIDLQAALKQVQKNTPSTSSNAQAGSTSGTGGTTSLISQGKTAQLLSVATEYGALTETQSNQTVTVQGTLDGPLAAVTRQYIVGYCTTPGNNIDPYCLSPKLHNILRDVSYGVTFNTASPNQTVSGMSSTTATTASTASSAASSAPILFTASGRQISAVTVKGVLWDGGARNVSQTAKDNWTKAVADVTSGQYLKTALGVAEIKLKDLLDRLGLPAEPSSIANQKDPKIKAFLNFYLNYWYPKTLQALKDDQKKNDSTSFAKDFNQAIQELYPQIILADPSIDQTAADVVRASSVAQFTVQDLYAQITAAPVLTVEYDDTRPQNQNSYSTVKLIFNKGFGNWSFTLNGAVSLNTTTYSTVPSSGTIRSTQAGAELKYSFGNLTILGQAFGNAALSGTYYYQYQNSPSVLNVTPGTPLTGITITGLPSTATQIFAQRGTINLAQIRLEMGSGSSLKFPIAISYSNRTELITKPEFRAQIGVAYNFDSLFGGGQSK